MYTYVCILYTYRYISHRSHHIFMVLLCTPITEDKCLKNRVCVCVQCLTTQPPLRQGEADEKLPPTTT